MATKKNPVGHPRTVNKSLPAGLTESGNPPRVRISGGPNRDQYAYRQNYEKKTGKKLSTNEVLDHARDTLSAKKNPNAEVKPVTRSQNSKADGGLRHPGGKNKRGK